MSKCWLRYAKRTLADNWTQWKIGEIDAFQKQEVLWDVLVHIPQLDEIYTVACFLPQE